ncbi:MAG: hypothetical protein KKD44_14915 [Proteobacteria bacterium]|nr:hypothetical protein [Pseudomonadota bacterium]
MKALHLKTIFPSSMGFIAIFFLCCLTIIGCGEGKYATEPESLSTEAQDGLTSADASQTSAMEHWETQSALLSAPLSATFTPSNGLGTPLSRSGDEESLQVSLTLAEQSGIIRAHGSISLDGSVSVTGYPMTLEFRNFPFEITADSITISGTDILTTKTQSGVLIRPSFNLTMDIKKGSAQKFMCHGVFQVDELQTICEFSVEIHRTGGNNLISFFESTWAKKSPSIDISYPRKLYYRRTEAHAVPTRDILNLSINESLIDPRASGFIDLPSTLSPNQTDLRIDFTNLAIMASDLNQILTCHASGTLETPDMQGTLISTDYSLDLEITKKVITESFTGENNTPELRQVAQYKCTAALILSALNVRTTLVDTLTRTDSSDIEALFAHAVFTMAQEKTYTVTHSFSEGETTDIVHAPYGLIGLNLNFNPSGTGSALAQGMIGLPFEATPDGAPFMVISFDNAQPDISENGTIHLSSPAQLDKTDAIGFITSIGAMLTLDMNPTDEGIYVCAIDLSSDDLMTRINFTDLELMRTDPGEDLSSSQWTVLGMPYHRVACSMEGVNTNQKINDMDMDVDLTLSKVFNENGYDISASGSVGIITVLDCMGHGLNLDFSDVPVIVEDGGFEMTTQVSQDDITYSLSVRLVETDTALHEFLVDISQHNGPTLNLTLPAERTQGTGIFIRSGLSK